MSICHYLFWQEKDRVITILNKGNAFEIIKFGGYTEAEYTSDYWEKWCEYAGFLKDDDTDFCFIFDKECPQLPEYLKSRECLENECKWDKHSIQKVADMLDLTRPTKIYNREGVCVAKVGRFRNIQESEIVELIAAYRTPEKASVKEEFEPIEMTPFIEKMLTKLKLYDEN